MTRTLLTLLMAGGLLVAPGMAQEREPRRNGETAAEEHKGGVPEVSVLWKWVNFALLAAALGYLAAKQAGPILAKRSSDIAQGLESGEKAKTEAEAKAKEVDARLGNLDAEIAKLRSQARQDREREAVRLQHELIIELDRIRHHADMEIESATKQASIEVRRHAAALALELAEIKIKAAMSPEVQAALVSDFAQKVVHEGTGAAVAS